MSRPLAADVEGGPTGKLQRSRRDLPGPCRDSRGEGEGERARSDAEARPVPASPRGASGAGRLSGRSAPPRRGPGPGPGRGGRGGAPGPRRGAGRPPYAPAPPPARATGRGDASDDPRKPRALRRRRRALGRVPFARDAPPLRPAPRAPRAARAPRPPAEEDLGNGNRQRPPALRATRGSVSPPAGPRARMAGGGGGASFQWSQRGICSRHRRPSLRDRNPSCQTPNLKGRRATYSDTRTANWNDAESKT